MGGVLGIANNQNFFRIFDSENNPNPTNNWCTRAIHNVTKIPSYLINAWKGSSPSQKVFGATASIYCIAATVYIIYLRAQENIDCDCLQELARNSSLLDQFFEQKNQEHNGSLQDLVLSIDRLLAKKDKCEEDFYNTGIHESGQSGIISMHVCYHLIDRVCHFLDASEEMLTITSEFLQKIPTKLLNNVTDIVRRMDDDLYYIHAEFDCDLK